MAALDPGQMRDRITILKRTLVTWDPATYDDNDPSTWPPDNLGEEIFTDYRTIWARTKYVSGREFRQLSSTSNQAKVTFSIRYRTDINVVDRIRFGGLIWNIVTVSPVAPEGRKIGLDLNCESIGAAT